jgi:Undecaprenyl-phosphate glucose phosphotransferase
VKYQSTRYDYTSGSAGLALVSIEPWHAWIIAITAAEFLSAVASAYFGSAVYHILILHSWPDLQKYIPAAVFIGASVLFVSIGFHHFTGVQSQPRHRFLWNGAGAVALAFSFFLSMMFLLKIAEDYSRGAFFFQIASVAVAVLWVRAVWHSRLQYAIASGAIEARRAILIGDANHCSQVAIQLQRTGIRSIHSFRLLSNSTEKISSDQNAPLRRAHCRKVAEGCRLLRADDLLILPEEKDLAIARALAESLSELPADIHILPIGAADLLATGQLVEFGNLVTIRVSKRPLSVFDCFIKRTTDIVIATVGVILFLPLLLIVSIIIKLDSIGPVFFRQTRHGYNNELIRVLKFRSMFVMEDEDNFRQAVRNDPRVTRIGRILRRANIDELPQLFNVLLGEMSIVGPRPHATAHNKMFEEQISRFWRRHNVKPGITGWAQVNGYRGETDTVEKMRRRIQYDLYYIDNWSPVFDIKIMIMTLFSKSTYLNGY